MDMREKAAKGESNSTWDRIYLMRQDPDYADPRITSENILTSLLTKGKMPVQFVQNFHVKSLAFMGLSATDDGIDIHLTARLRKNCDIRASLALLGEQLQAYAVMTETEVAPLRDEGKDPLQGALGAVMAGAMTLGRNPNAKPTPELSRAVGLFLWDKTAEKSSFTDAVNALMGISRQYRSSEAITINDMDLETLRRYCKKTGECIALGMAMPLS